jgi:hypothetical protein
MAVVMADRVRTDGAGLACVCARPCDPDCGCLAKMGNTADPYSEPPKECWGTPGLTPLSAPNVPRCVAFRVVRAPVPSPHRRGALASAAP